MGFSDQEDKTLNSAEAPESEDTGSTEAADSPRDEAEAVDATVDNVVEDQVEPDLSEADATEEPDPEQMISNEEATEPEPAQPEANDLDSDSESPDEGEMEGELTQEAQPDLTESQEMEEIPEFSIEKATAALLQDEAPVTDSESSEMAEEEAIEEEGEDDGRAWYVVHCYSGYENKVRHNLEQRIETMGMKDMIFDIVVPTEEEIEVREGKRRTVERRVFPGYILVNMIMTEESWYVVRNTPGVTGFVGMGNTPTPLRPEEVSQIIKRMEAEAPRIKVTFKSGERVRIVDGPFNDFRGTVAEIDMERAKVRVMVNFFGRETPVELDFLQVEKT